MKRPKRSLLGSALLLLSVLTGCHSHQIAATVENRTGSPIQLLEVEYPSAAFGANSMAAGEALQYRIQIRGSGQLRVQYSASSGQVTQIVGPSLAERQEGRLRIVLLPGGKADFISEPGQ